jgi:hypothetical protein
VDEEKNLCHVSVFKTHGKDFFAVRRKIRRTAKIRYRAFCMTHGKEALCRAPDKRRTPKFKRTAKAAFPVVAGFNLLHYALTD